MNILFPDRLTKAKDELHNLLSGHCDRYDEVHDTISLTFWEQVREQNPHLETIVNAGFGYSISNYRHNNNYLRLIIINEANCNRAELNNDEFRAIVLHELGHLLNNPELENEPSTLECIRNNINKNTVDEIKHRNGLKKEIYADAYAKQYGHSTHVIEGFTKYNNSFGQSVGFLNERIAALNNDLDYNDGTIKLINRNF